MEFETSIGLEVHVQLLTVTKLFCGCYNKYGLLPNTNVCPVCAGFPGALPVLNNEAVEFAVKTTLALFLSIAPQIQFSRKNYFYPDLPKGYQISQFDFPVAVNGYIDIKVDGKAKHVGILRLHLEEDAGKLIHGLDENKKEAGLIDYNRAGVPLIEVVTYPDMKTSKEAAEFIKHLRSIVRYLGVSDGNMEQGSLRCDVNISVHEKDKEGFGTRVEIKNLNSVRHTIRAIEFERQRQSDIIRSGGIICQETRLWDEKQQATVLMREKEYSDDYRYFPEPDLASLKIDEKLIARIKVEMPEFKCEKIERFLREYGLSIDNAENITECREMADYFEEAVAFYNNPEKVCDWIINLIRSKLADSREISRFIIKPVDLSQLLGMIDDGTITRRIAKYVFEEMFQSGKKAEEIVSQKGLFQISDRNEISKIIQLFINNNEKMVEDYRGGKEKLFSYFVGQIMKETGGRANLEIVNEVLKKRLLSE